MHKNAATQRKKIRRPVYERRKRGNMLLQKRDARMFAEREGFRVPERGLHLRNMRFV